MRILRFSGRVSGELRYFSKSDSAGVKRQDRPPPIMTCSQSPPMLQVRVGGLVLGLR